MIVKIKRQESTDSQSYWQSFNYEGEKHVAVSAILDAINYTDDLYDIEGNRTSRVKWECSCSQAMCGGCAMVINGIPSLACATFVDEIKGEILILEPLSKFPVIADLIVDRSVIYDNLKQSQVFLESIAISDEKEISHQYSVAKCLKCGLCLEVCPNYYHGNEFFGATFANESYLITSQMDGKSDILKQYKDHFAAGCSKALSCQSICPAKIETLSSILKMNRK